MLRQTVLPLSIALLMSACGSSSSVDPVDPISETGFATKGKTIADPYEFTLKNIIRTSDADGEAQGETNEANLQQKAQSDIRLVKTSDKIEIEFNGKTYTLERNEENTRYENFVDGDDIVSLWLPLTNSDYAAAYSLFSLIDGRFDSARFVAGYDTDPAEIERTTGSVEYNGRVSFALRRGFFDAFGNGDITLTANFDDQKIGGTAILSDKGDSNSEFSFDPIAVKFERADIDQNGYVGKITVAAGDLDGGTLKDGRYDGRFFGPNAESVGGQINGRVELEDQEDDVLIDGAYLANK